jgi:hypothetical protein
MSLQELLDEALRLAKAHDFEALDGVLARLENRIGDDAAGRTPAVNARLAEVMEICERYLTNPQQMPR